MTAPEIKAKLLNIVAVGGYTFNPDLENGEFSQPHQSYSSRIAPLEEIPDLFDLAVKLLQEQSSDQNLSISPANLPAGNRRFVASGYKK